MCKKSKLRLGSYTLKFDFNGHGYTIVKIKGKGADLIIPKEFNDGKHGAHNMTAIRHKACGKYRYHRSIHYTGNIASWCRITGLDAIVSSFCMLCIDGNLIDGDLVIPEGVTSIGDYAFYNCRGLTGITIPDSVTNIGDFTFFGCIGLTSISISNSATSIGWFAFKDCTGLTSITIPSSVTRIGWAAFCNCPTLTIYCEAKSKPDGWDNDWNPDNRPVVWGAQMMTNANEDTDDGIICK